MTFILNSLLVVFGIGLLIFIHELGHFIAARMIGARVEVFSLGFGPRLFGFRRGHTDYRVAAIPLGGYVQVAGQDPTDDRYPAEQSLNSKSIAARTWFFSGGVLMNLLFALVTFPLVFSSGVPFAAPEVGGVYNYGSAAWEAQLQPGDRILEINGKSMYSFNNMGVETALRGGRNKVTYKIQRGDEEFLLDIAPHFNASMGLYELGVSRPVEGGPPPLTVKRGGPADRAGVQAGDLLLTLNGSPAEGGAAATAFNAVDPAAATPVSITVRRGDQELAFEITPEPIEPTLPRVGVAAIRRTVLGVRDGLAPLAKLDLRPDDVILAVDGAPFHGPDLESADGAWGLVTMTVRRGDQELDLSATFTEDQRLALAEHVALGQDIDTLTVTPQPDSPASRAGILHGDRVHAVDGRTLSGWDDMRELVQGAAAATSEPLDEVTAPVPCKTLRFTVARGDQLVELDVTPERAPQFDHGFEPQIPIKREIYQKDTFGGAIQAGMVCSVDLIKQLYVTLKRLFTGEVAAKNLGGIITISRVSYQFAQWGPARFFYFLALLSINLAFINVLPIPVLDGGHLVFLLIEKIKGSPVSAKVFTYSQIMGLIFVLALIVFVTYNDILRLL